MDEVIKIAILSPTSAKDSNKTPSSSKAGSKKKNGTKDESLQTGQTVTH